MSCQEGLFAGVTFKQRLIRSSIPGLKRDLAKTGFLDASKAGKSLEIILCKIKPKDQISIFSKLSFIRFSGKMIFSFISGA